MRQSRKREALWQSPSSVCIAAGGGKPCWQGHTCSLLMVGEIAGSRSAGAASLLWSRGEGVPSKAASRAPAGEVGILPAIIEPAIAARTVPRRPTAGRRVGACTIAYYHTKFSIMYYEPTRSIATWIQLYMYDTGGLHDLCKMTRGYIVCRGRPAPPTPLAGPFICVYDKIQMY